MRRTVPTPVRGHFAAIPWNGEFFYELHSRGFHSTNAEFLRKYWTTPNQRRRHQRSQRLSRI